ncbi:hypothetical protein [Pseudomonas syringae group genomosp. 3]|uniref:hypothetical protein n=1 Tax=Pseudomonas syringae group genomosp. 3 TaxID=251701 RepID=UPI000EFB5688|nr:hypothetical protein [Pseudomonas syringae group genomosp. 3]
MKDKPHDEAMVDYFRAEPSYAAELLAQVCNDGNQAEVAIVLRQVTAAFGKRWLGLAPCKEPPLS